MRTLILTIIISCTSAASVNAPEIARIKSTVYRNDNVYQFREQDIATLLNSMKQLGYKNLNGYSINELRRIMIAYEYDALFWDMHDRTGLPISFFFAFFIFEATRDGLETEMWRNHWNPGGIKYKGKYNVVKKYDDCKGKCDFASMPNYAAAIDMWSDVLLQPRYSACKSKARPIDICKCIKEAGYHSDNSYTTRARLMGDYWKYRKSFPILD